MKVNEVIAKVQGGLNVAKWLINQHQHVAFEDKTTICGSEAAVTFVGTKLVASLAGHPVLVVNNHDYSIDKELLKTQLGYDSLRATLYWFMITFLEFGLTMDDVYTSYIACDELLDELLDVELKALDVSI